MHILPISSPMSYNTMPHKSLSTRTIDFYHLAGYEYSNFSIAEFEYRQPFEKCNP